MNTLFSTKLSILIQLGGPRQCIGQRFSMVQMKLMLAKLLHKYRLVATENTKLEHCKGVPLILVFDEIKIKLEERVEE